MLELTILVEEKCGQILVLKVFDTLCGDSADELGVRVLRSELGKTVVQNLTLQDTIK